MPQVIAAALRYAYLLRIAMICWFISSAAGCASERQVLSKYGSPVFCIVEGKIDVGRVCLYRDPLKYFSTERIYLYFDKDQKLSSWKAEPPSL